MTTALPLFEEATTAAAVGIPLDRTVRPLVERLRASMAGFDTCVPGAAMAREAADEIERLRDALRRVMFDALGEPRTAYERLTLDGAHMVLTTAEAEAYLATEPLETTYLRTTVYLSEREFEDLPEFDGF
jgi:hypothetical protein